jgi:hypothetical protein
MREEHVKDFPDSDWIIEDDDCEPQQEERYYDENACDGWEDIYPL